MLRPWQEELDGQFNLQQADRKQRTTPARSPASASSLSLSFPSASALPPDEKGEAAAVLRQSGDGLLLRQHEPALPRLLAQSRLPSSRSSRPFDQPTPLLRTSASYWRGAEGEKEEEETEEMRDEPDAAAVSAAISLSHGLLTPQALLQSGGVLADGGSSAGQRAAGDAGRWVGRRQTAGLSCSAPLLTSSALPAVLSAKPVLSSRELHQLPFIPHDPVLACQAERQSSTRRPLRLLSLSLSAARALSPALRRSALSVDEVNTSGCAVQTIRSAVLAAKRGESRVSAAIAAGCSPPPRRSALSAQAEAKAKQDLYKTEICRNWGATGRCSYGNKCKYGQPPSTARGASSRQQRSAPACCPLCRVSLRSPMAAAHGEDDLKDRGRSETYNTKVGSRACSVAEPSPPPLALTAVLSVLLPCPAVHGPRTLRQPHLHVRPSLQLRASR